MKKPVYSRGKDSKYNKKTKKKVKRSKKK